jgi:trigger factor
MNITVKNHDEVSALLTVTVDRADYATKVEKALINYAKNATVPGFRKGKAPMSMIKRQFEEGLAFEEINKIVSEGINTHLDENKIRLVGQAIPVPVDEFNIHGEQINVSFELGFEPEFSVDLAKFEAPLYKVTASDKEINESISNMQKRFANQESQEAIADDSHIELALTPITAEPTEETLEEMPVTVSILQKEAFEKIKTVEADKKISLSVEDLQANEELAKQLNINPEVLAQNNFTGINVDIKNIYKLIPAELNQDLFDKVYGEGEVSSEDELKAKIKTELDEYFQDNANNFYSNTILERIAKETEIKLPETFLVKWLLHSNQNIRTEEQAQEILVKEKQIIKQQIIESRLFAENEIKIDYSDIIAQAEASVRNQLAMYGMHNLPDEQVQQFASEILKQEQQVRQIQADIVANKLKDVVLEKATKKEEVISHEDFIALIKKSNEEAQQAIEA